MCGGMYYRITVFFSDSVAMKLSSLLPFPRLSLVRQLSQLD